MLHREPAHIVYVDDDRNCLSGMDRSLRHRRSDLRLTLLDDPRAALDFILAERPDVVISDMQMPFMCGTELLRAVRRAEPGIACMILSGVADLSTALTAINDLQIFRYLTKPCPGAVVSDAISAALEAYGPAVPGTGVEEMSGVDRPHQVRLDAAFDYVSMGLLVLDAEGRLHHANQRAQTLIGERDGLIVTPTGQVRGATSAQTKDIMRCVRAACADVAASSPPVMATLPRPSMKRDLSLFSVPMPIDGPAGGRAVMAGVFILDPDHHDAPSPEIIADMFGLTNSEASIVCDLVTGATLETAAGRAGVTLSTARTYLKRTFVKTGTSKQTELTSLVIRSTFGISNPASFAFS